MAQECLLTETGKILPRLPDPPCVPTISQTDLFYIERALETGVCSHNDYAPEPSQDPLNLHQHHRLPSAIRQKSQPTSDDDSQYSQEDEDYVMSDEEPGAKKQLGRSPSCGSSHVSS